LLPMRTVCFPFLCYRSFLLVFGSRACHQVGPSPRASFPMMRNTSTAKYGRTIGAYQCPFCHQGFSESVWHMKWHLHARPCLLTAPLLPSPLGMLLLCLYALPCTKRQWLNSGCTMTYRSTHASTAWQWTSARVHQMLHHRHALLSSKRLPLRGPARYGACMACLSSLQPTPAQPPTWPSACLPWARDAQHHQNGTNVSV
jgi:hypothetical protein